MGPGPVVVVIIVVIIILLVVVVAIIARSKGMFCFAGGSRGRGKKKSIFSQNFWCQSSIHWREVQLGSRSVGGKRSFLLIYISAWHSIALWLTFLLVYYLLSCLFTFCVTSLISHCFLYSRTKKLCPPKLSPIFFPIMFFFARRSRDEPGLKEKKGN